MPAANDQLNITWVRLVDGRLWHVATDVPIATRCGREAVSIGATLMPERTPHPPANGWICERCVRALAEQAAAARQAWLQDPRRRPDDQLPAPSPDSPPEPEIAACDSVINVPGAGDVMCALQPGHLAFHTDRVRQYQWLDPLGGEFRANPIQADVTPAGVDDNDQEA